MGRVALVSGLCLLALAPVVAERVEAVILLHDDEVHTFRTVSGALESLGLSPPQALLVTSDVHSTGVGLVCKGTRAELRVAYDRLANEGLNVTLRTTEQTDVEVRRAAKLATSGTAAARRVNAALREAAVSRRECTVWSLAGACVREALAMYAHLGCAAECVDNSARFQQAAHRRPPLRVEMISVQVAGVLGAALGAAEAWTRLLRSGGGAGEADDLLPAATAARTRGVATALLAQHFLVAGAREALAAVTGGGEEGSWQLDDSEVAVSFALEGEGEGEGEGEEEGEDFNTEGAGEGGRAAPQPAAEPDMEVPDTELGLSETESDPPDEGEAPSWLAALVFWLGGLLSTLPRWLLFSYGLMQAAAAVAAVVAARVVEGSAADAAAAAAASWSGASAAAQAQADSAAVRLRRSGSLLWLVSILGAGHVLVSAGYMFVMGAGVHVSEVMAKRVSLVGGVAVWLAHVTLVRPGERSRQSEARASRLPMTKRDAASAMGSPFAGCVDGRARRRGALLAAGRMMVAGLLAAVGGTELWRLIGTPFTSFDLGDGHDALHLRLPQLLLALPLAIGAATSRVSTALAFLLLSEAALVWLPRCAAAAASLLAFYFWGLAGGGPSDSIIEVVEAVRITEMPPRLATAVDHFTVNLAVAGALLLLPAFGSGRFSIDALVKKRD